MNILQETIGQISNQVTEKWSGLSKKNKIQIVVGAVAIVVIIAIVAFLNRTQMRVLYNTSQDTKFIAETAEVLEAKSIEHRIISDGTNIEVDDEQYNSAIMALSLEGVSNTGYSFEDAMNNSMSTTDDEKKQKMNNFTKEELQRAIKEIEGVEDARVLLVIPEEKNSFIQSTQESTASVMLTLSKPITSKQAEGIANYMAFGVKNLEKKNITIMDTNGTTLYAGSDDEEGIALTKQQELKQQVENQIKENIKNLLTGLYDDVKISANVVLDFDQQQEVSEEYSTQGDDEQRGVIQNETVSGSSTTNTTTGGEPGTGTNGGDTTQYVVGGNVAGESKTNDKQINYQPNKKQTTWIKSIGDVDAEKSSLAVNLFKRKIYKEEEVAPTLVGTTWAEFKAQNGGQQNLQVDEGTIEAIQNATGIRTVSINAYETPVFYDKEAYQIDYTSWLPFILILLIVIVAIIALMRFRKQDEEIEVEPELEVEEMLKTAKEQVELDEIELKETLETKRQIDKFVDEKPEAVANLLRNWLNDEDWE